MDFVELIFTLYKFIKIYVNLYTIPKKADGIKVVRRNIIFFINFANGTSRAPSPTYCPDYSILRNSSGM